MHKFLLTLAFLISFATSASAQLTVSGVGGGFGGTAPVTCSSSEGNAFLARTTGLDNTHKTRYCTLIDALVTDGLCCAATGGKLDGLWVFTTADATTAKLNVTQNAYNLTQTGTPTSFTADVGYTGDASTFYLDTNFNITTSVGNFSRDSASIGCYILLSRTADQNWAAIGEGRNSETRLYPKQAAGPGGLIFEATDGVGANFFTNGDAKGLWTVTRTTSTLTTLYKNAAAASSATSAHASSALTTEAATMLLFAWNSSGTPTGFSGDQMGACYMGAGMSNAQVINLHSRINAYMTSYSVAAY